MHPLDLAGTEACLRKSGPSPVGVGDAVAAFSGAPPAGTVGCLRKTSNIAMENHNFQKVNQLSFSAIFNSYLSLPEGTNQDWD